VHRYAVHSRKLRRSDRGTNSPEAGGGRKGAPAQKRCCNRRAAVSRLGQETWAGLVRPITSLPSRWPTSIPYPGHAAPWTHGRRSRRPDSGAPRHSRGRPVPLLAAHPHAPGGPRQAPARAGAPPLPPCTSQWLVLVPCLLTRTMLCASIAVSISDRNIALRIIHETRRADRWPSGILQARPL
jgi:hypothetical protein